MNRTDRLLAILLEMQARGELRAEDLAHRFEVSVRTIYRDVQALSEGGVPFAAIPGKGYRLMEGYFLPPLTFSAQEAALLVLGGEFIERRVDAGLRPAAESALRKIASILPAEHKQAVERWRRELLFPVFRANPAEPRLPVLREAIQAHTVVRLLYHTYRRLGAEWRDVEPVSLVHVSEQWHLAAFCRLREGPRLFRLDRIDRLDRLDEIFTPGPRHTMGPAYEQQPAVPVARVCFDASVHRWVRERQPYIFLREEFDVHGPIFVYALRDEQELLTWLLSWGAAVEVLDPPALRYRMVAEAVRILERHSSGSAFGEASSENFLSGQVATDRTVSVAPP